jgi:hypothetical protein
MLRSLRLQLQYGHPFTKFYTMGCFHLFVWGTDITGPNHKES